MEIALPDFRAVRAFAGIDLGNEAASTKRRAVLAVRRQAKGVEQ